MGLSDSIDWKQLRPRLGACNSIGESIDFFTNWRSQALLASVVKKASELYLQGSMARLTEPQAEQKYVEFHEIIQNFTFDQRTCKKFNSGGIWLSDIILEIDKVKASVGTMAQFVKCLPCKHKDPTPTSKSGAVVHGCDLNTGRVETSGFLDLTG